MSLIQVTDLSFTYDESTDPVFEHVSFHIDTDWKLGFTGRNGRGKTTFLNLLMNRYNYTGLLFQMSCLTISLFLCRMKNWTLWKFWIPFLGNIRFGSFKENCLN